jgi:hypothetical protein
MHKIITTTLASIATAIPTTVSARKRSSTGSRKTVVPSPLSSSTRGKRFSTGATRTTMPKRRASPDASDPSPRPTDCLPSSSPRIRRNRQATTACCPTAAGRRSTSRRQFHPGARRQRSLPFPLARQNSRPAVRSAVLPHRPAGFARRRDRRRRPRANAGDVPCRRRSGRGAPRDVRRPRPRLASGHGRQSGRIDPQVGDRARQRVVAAQRLDHARPPETRQAGG